MTEHSHELLHRGVAGVDRDLGPDEADQGQERLAVSVRINPLGEGDVTVGASGEPTVWDREVLERAVNAGAFDGAEIIQGRGGEQPHYPLDEHVPPEAKLGRVDSWTYEPGVGPVGEADVVDGDIADRIDLDLLDVSADMLRVLGDYDADREANTVEEIVAVPRITVLDRGASKSASIEPSRAEALGLDPSKFAAADVEQLQDITVSDPVYSGTTESDSWDAPTFGTYNGDIERARNAALIIRDDGSTFDDLSLFVVNGDGNLDLAGLRAAKSRASQTSDVSGDTLSRVQTKINRLAADEFDVDWSDDEQTAAARVIDALDTFREALRGFGRPPDSEPDGADDPPETEIEDDGEPAESGHATDADDDTPESEDTTDMSDNDTEQNLREQLAEVQSEKTSLEQEVATLKSRVDDLEGDVEEKDEEIEAKEAEVESKDDQIEEKDEEIEELNETVAPVTELLAEIVAGDSMLDAEEIAERYSPDELVDKLADDDGDGDDDDRSYSEKVREQLAANIAPRGDAGGGENRDTEAQEQAEQLARAVMTARDYQKADREGLDEVEFLREYKGADPFEFNSEDALRTAVRSNGGDR